MAELNAANQRLMRLQASLADAQPVSPAELDSVVVLRRHVTQARMRAVEMNAEHRRELELLVRAAQAAARAPGAQGYFGVNVMQFTAPSAAGGPTESPRIASVEPGSPAAKAGLRAGDRLVSVGHVRLRDGGDLAPLLRPGNELRVRFERDGRPQEAMVRIEPRPLGFRSGVSIAVTEVAGEAPVVRMLPAPGTRVVAGTPAREGVFQRTVVTGAPDGRGSVLVVNTRRTSVIAGAEVAQLDSTLRHATGAARGLYVLEVVPGLHAARAGVRQGDVLLRAGDAVLDTPVDLIRAFELRREAGARQLAVELLRNRRAQAVEIRW